MREMRVGFRDAAGKLSITKDQLVREIVSIAEDELAFWSRDGDPLTDRSPDGVGRITGYLTYLWDGSVPTMPKKGGGRRAFDPSQDAWSAVFVCYCVTYAFENLFGKVDDRAAFRKRVPLGRELIDFQYAKAAHVKRDAGDRGRREARGHYWAYDTGITVEPGDIVVKDRRRLEPGMANLRFGDLRRLAGQSTRADIVTRIEDNTAILVGGDLGDSVKETRYPLKGGLVDRRHRRNAANRVFSGLRLVPQTDDVTSTGQRHPVAPKSVKQELPVAPSDGEWRVVILVPGTSDPVNTDPDSKAGERYWDEPFLTSLRKFCSPLPRCELVTDFEWSGDNNLDERKKAGKSLWSFVRNLPLDPEEPTSLHFIGHSHGGNVINEFTKASAGDMPAEWRIGSITYLSTPFIPAHTPVLSRFADDAVVINVANTYDLTQRVIADFTLAQSRAREFARDSGLATAIAVARARWPGIPRLAFGSRDFSDGIVMWRLWIDFMDTIPNVMETLEHFVELLRRDNEQLVKDDVVDMLRTLRLDVNAWVSHSREILDLRVSRWRHASQSQREANDYFNTLTFLEDIKHKLGDVLRSVNTLLGVHHKPVDSPLLVTIAGLVINSLELLSDTRSDPSQLFPRDGKRIPILDINIEKYDPYDATGRRGRYEAFARDLETLQQQSIVGSQREQETLLREALLMIVAQMNFEGPLKRLRDDVLKPAFVSKGVGLQLEDLASGITTLLQELSSKDRNLLPDRQESLEAVLSGGELTYIRRAPGFEDLHAKGLGDIVRYFIYTSHNLSRSALFDEVKTVLGMRLR